MFDDTGSTSNGCFRARGLLIRDTLVKDSKRIDLLHDLFNLRGNGVHEPLHVHLDTPMFEYTMEVIVLPILTSSEGREGSLYHGEYRFNALLLQKKVGAPNGVYTRIGHMNSKNSLILEKEKELSVR